MNIITTDKSTNHSPRGDNGTIEMVVMHSTEGTRKSDIPILLGQTNRKVSAHYYIQRDGVVRQFVPDNRAAWHAGVSTWLQHGSGWIQLHSIGIEMENLNTAFRPNRQEYPEVQYNAALELVRGLVQKYDIEPVYVVRHKDIAPGRKADPAGFDWTRFKKDVFTGGTKPSSLEPASNPDTISTAPDTPYQTDNADWIPNPVEYAQEQIETAADTAASNAMKGLFDSIVKAWQSFLDSFKRS